MRADRLFVSALQSGGTVDQLFLVREKEMRTSRNGEFYLTCTLCDRTGNMPARMWRISEVIYNSIPLDGFLHVKGRVEDYKGSLQLIIDACRPYPGEKVELADFVPVTELDVEVMWTQLLEILRDVKDPALRQLVKKFTEDHALVAAFKKAPAAMSMHHPFLGGLLEHTLNVARVAKTLLPLYPKVNADLVLTGAFLHDIGKAAELQAGMSMQYTDRGMLVGHITIAAIWISEKAAAIAAESGQAFPTKTLDLLQHIILAHHGEYDFGSPKLPMVPEAFFLHYVDNLDAKMWMTTHEIAKDANGDSSFTQFIRGLETRLYKASGEL